MDRSRVFFLPYFFGYESLSVRVKRVGGQQADSLPVAVGSLLSLLVQHFGEFL